MKRRELLGKLGRAAGVCALPIAVEAGEQREAKPLTTASLAQSLLRLADKAERQGMRAEAQAIYTAVKVVMTGTKAGTAIIPCDTDSDCRRKNGGDGYGEGE